MVVCLELSLALAGGSSLIGASVHIDMASRRHYQGEVDYAAVVAKARGDAMTWHLFFVSWWHWRFTIWRQRSRLVLETQAEEQNPSCPCSPPTGSSRFFPGQGMLWRGSAAQARGNGMMQLRGESKRWCWRPLEASCDMQQEAGCG